MQAYEYIQIVSTFIWTIIPFFLYKSKHFFFFLFAGLCDFIGLSFWYAFHISSQITWIPLLYLMVFSIDRDYFIKNIKWILGGLVILLGVNFFSTTYLQYLFTLLTNITISIIFLRYLYWEYIHSSKLSLFYLVMTFYGLLSVYQSILLVSNINLGLNAYYVDTVIQIGIGLFLIFMKKDYQFSLRD